MSKRLEELTDEQVAFLKHMDVTQTLKEKGYLHTMYELQEKFDDALNEKRGIKFKNDEYTIKNIFALYSEFGELIDEIGWPWWKEKQTDAEGLLNEVRDLHHFNLKSMILDDVSISDIINYLEAAYGDVVERDGHDDDSYIDACVSYTYDLQKEEGIKERFKVFEVCSTEERISFSLLEALNIYVDSVITGTIEKKHDGFYALELAQVLMVLLLMQKEYGMGMKEVFESYVDKNIENHRRQKGTSKDATRVNYSDNQAAATRVIKDGENFVIINELGQEFKLTKETLFEMNRM